MKAERGRGGVVENIVYRDIMMRNILSEAVQMTLNYHAGLKPTNATATPIFRNILIENVYADGCAYAGLYGQCLSLLSRRLLTLLLFSLSCRGRNHVALPLNLPALLFRWTAGAVRPQLYVKKRDRKECEEGIPEMRQLRRQVRRRYKSMPSLLHWGPSACTACATFDAVQADQG